MGMRQPGYTWRRGAWFRARAAGPAGSHDADLGAGRDADLGAGGGLGARDGLGADLGAGAGLGADLSAGGGLGAGAGLGADLSAGGRLGARPGIASRPSGWPVLRTPKWMLAAAVVLVAGLTLAAIPHRPSTAQRAADLRGMVHDLNIDIESCAGGVSDSITALRAIQSGASNDVNAAVKIANLAAANCSPANSMPMEDLVQYQAPGSLASFHVQTTVNDLVTWGFPLAQRVQTDVATVVTANTPDAVKRASAQLRKDQQALDAQRDRIDQLINAASTSLAAHVAPPSLPS